ncbi:putative bacteriophage protein [Yersinia frederiksenii]|nr:MULTISPECIES: hypothetical protein [Yersinia]MDN0096193.1 hypothetical protein [Yersinia rohdei]MDN0120710.1 hypothetical protein [Yersinia frederiksenii]CNC23395.1 putative bacteriophage protein [Yersinia frederiksenii]
MRMEPVTSHNLPYWWSLALGVFSLLSLQDYIFILGAVISAFFTIKTYYAKRREENARLLEEQKRTEILRTFLNNATTLPISDRSAAVEIVAEAVKRSEESYEQAK